MKYSVLVGGYFAKVEFTNKQRALNYAKRQAKSNNAFWSVYDKDGYEIANGKGGTPC